MECLNGNEADVDDCIAEIESWEAEADAYDCGDEWTELSDCREANSHCEDDPVAGDVWTNDGDCDDEKEDLGDCKDRASSRD
jgi:hypothetical protein